jgi:hypothetical protein
MRSENRELWLSRVSAYRESGMSTRTWCQENNVSITALRYWLRKTENDQSTTKDQHEFVQILSSSLESRNFVPATIRLGMISIEISDSCHPDTIKNIIDALKSYA